MSIKSDDDLKRYLFKCSRLVKACDRSTQNLLNYAKEGDLDNCELESQNRGRLIKTIKDYCREIEKAGLKDTDSVLFRSWEKKFRSFVRNNSVKDGEILGLLKESRRGIRRELASIYKIRRKIQNYNPNNI